MASGADIALLALITLAKASSAAPSEPIPIRVEFDSPAGCSDVDAFYAGVLARSDRARRAASGEEGVRLGVRVTRAGGRVRGELRILDGRADTETRRVDGVRCDEVVEVLSLTAALAIDPTARLAAVRPPPPAPGASSATAAPPGSPSAVAPSAAPPAPSTVPPPAPSPDSPAPPPAPGATLVATPPGAPLRAPASPRRFRLELGVRAVGAEVLSPTVSLGGSISLRLQRAADDELGPSVSIAVLYLSNDLVVSADEALGRWAAAALTGCPGWGLGKVITVEPCAQFVGGWLQVRELAVTNPGTAARSWWSVGGLVRVAAAIGREFSLELEAGVGVPLLERRFIITTPERVVGRTPTLSGSIAVGIARGF